MCGASKTQHNTGALGRRGSAISGRSAIFLAASFQYSPGRATSWGTGRGEAPTCQIGHFPRCLRSITDLRPAYTVLHAEEPLAHGLKQMPGIRFCEDVQISKPTPRTVCALVKGGRSGNRRPPGSRKMRQTFVSAASFQIEVTPSGERAHAGCGIELVLVRSVRSPTSTALS